jgi:hypothetical protein
VTSVVWRSPRHSPHHVPCLLSCSVPLCDIKSYLKITASVKLGGVEYRTTVLTPELHQGPSNYCEAVAFTFEFDLRINTSYLKSHSVTNYGWFFLPLTEIMHMNFLLWMN